MAALNPRRLTHDIILPVTYSRFPLSALQEGMTYRSRLAGAIFALTGETQHYLLQEV